MSLTSHLKQTGSPVQRFLVERFPNTRAVAAEVRVALAGASTIRPDEPVDWSLLGMAIDHRLRGYFGPVSFDGLPEISIQKTWGIEGLDFRMDVGSALDDQAKALASAGRRLERDDEEWLARLCLVLSLFDIIYRSGIVPPEIAGLSLETLTADRLLAIPQQSWVDDLCSLSWAFYDSHADLLNKPTIINPTFDGSNDIGGADADLVLDGCLLEIKTTINLRLKTIWLHQLLGYVLLDYSNQLLIDAVGFYFARQVRLIRWPLEDLLTTMAGRDLPPLAELRGQFKQVVQKQ